jgi:hypothetical protein
MGWEGRQGLSVVYAVALVKPIRNLGWECYFFLWKNKAIMDFQKAVNVHSIRSQLG